MSMPGRGEGVNLNVKLRTDSRPEQLLKELALSPLIYIRLLEILFSIIVFGCVADQVLVTNNICLYGVYSACSFAIAVGVISFLLCVAFIAKDVLYVIIDYSDNPVIKKVLLLVDAVANGLWGFMWFICFCLTADSLRKANLSIVTTQQVNCANSGVAFSFFSVLAYGAIVGINVFLFIRIAMGKDGYVAAPGTSEGGPGPSGYASFPEAGQGEDDQHRSQYAPPEY